MTSILNFLSSSSSNANLGNSSLFSKAKYPTTFIVQPPSSCQNKINTVLTKRYKPAELGDLLLKKIKTQASTSENTSQQSPTIKEEGFEDYENQMIEEIESPSTKSQCGNGDIATHQKIVEDVLIPQRSCSVPINFSGLLAKPSKIGANDSHKQVQHALEVLKKKMTIDQQASILKDILLKAQAAQGPLVIPPLLSSSSTESLIKKEKISLKKDDDDDESDVFYGEVEYPLLPLIDAEKAKKSSVPNFPAGKKEKTSMKRQKSKMSTNSSPGYENTKPFDLFDSLTVTRAETQRSESEIGSSLKEMSEEFLQMAKEGKRRNKKANSIKEPAEKGKKVQKKEKEEKSKTKKKDVLLSPLLSGKKMSERKKNKLQTQGEDQDQSMVPVGPKYQVAIPTLNVRSLSEERRTPKMKWDPLSQGEGELKVFFEELRNSLNINIDEEKAIKLLHVNGNDTKRVLESVNANKAKYTEELAMPTMN